MSSMIRRFAAVLAAMAVLLAWPGTAGATITGGCTGEGHSTSAGSDLTRDTVWHLKRDDVAGGSGTAPAKMRSASVAAYALGIGLPIASGTSKDGETSGGVDGVSVGTYAILGQRFVVGGSASGDAQCSGQISIILDDVNPLFTILGGGGILVAIVAVIILLLLSRSGGGCLQRIIGGVFGTLGGAGAALAGEQFGLLDPTQFIGLLIAVAAGIVGFLIPGVFSGAEVPPAAPASTPPPSPTPTPTPASGPTGPDHAGTGQTAEETTGGGDSPPTERYPTGGVGGGSPN